MRTGKIIDVNEPNPLDPPEHMLRDEFRRKPQSPSAPTGLATSQAAPPSSAVPRRERNASDHSEGLREYEPGEKPSAVGAAEVVGHGFSRDGAKRTEARQRWENRTEDQLHSAEGPRAAQSRFSGTNENSPPFQRREGEIKKENFLAAEGPRGASGPPASPVLACWGGGEQSATDKTAEPEPKDAKPKKDPNNPYSITTLLPDPPRPFESKPRDPCTDPPETPPPPKPKPGPRLHPWIEYWGLH